jgi:pyrrolidone-carboxylate peptidase
MNPPTLLLTAFQPFSGRSKNGSQTLLTWAKQHRSRLPLAKLQTTLLPVTWGGAVSQLRRALRKSPASQVLGVVALGEGSPGNIRWEQTAWNRAEGRDEAGVELHEPIDPKGPERLIGRWPLPSLHCAEVPLVASSDAGRFLCNRVLWELFRFSAARKSGPVRTTFLHLPPQGEKSDEIYLRPLTPVLQQLWKGLDFER